MRRAIFFALTLTINIGAPGIENSCDSNMSLLPDTLVRACCSKLNRIKVVFAFGQYSLKRYLLVELPTMMTWAPPYWNPDSSDYELEGCLLCGHVEPSPQFRLPG